MKNNIFNTLKILYTALGINKIKNKIAVNSDIAKRNHKIIIDNMNDMIVGLDIYANNFTFVSGSYYRVLGFTDEEYLQKPVKDIMTKESYQLVQETIKKEFTRYFNGEIDYPEATLEIQLYCKNGSTKWIEVSARTIINEQKEIVEIISISRDIDTRKRAEQQILQQKEEIYIADKVADRNHKIIIDNMNDMIVGLDVMANNFTFVSGACCKMLGYTCEEYLQKSVKDIMTKESYQLVQETIKKEFARYFNGEIEYPEATLEIQQYCKDGSIKWIEVSARTIINEQKEIVEIISISRDIDTRKRAEQQILQQKEELYVANKTKERFFSIISHDLKNPISSIHQMSELLNTDFAAVAAKSENSNSSELMELKDDIDLLNEAAEQAYKLLINLLEWARSCMDSISYTPQPNDLIKTVNECCRHLGAQASVKNISIEAPDVNTEMLAIYDENLILTVLRNLISNAIKFSFNDSFVKVEVADFNADYVVVSVLDSGTGISTEMLNKLFRIDEKIASVGTSGESGTGLGLILCKEFIDKHGSRIWVESEAGKGTKFLFTLPKNSFSCSKNMILKQSIIN